MIAPNAAQVRSPLVSCVMPTYNRRSFVPTAIRYFLRQDYPHRELVVIDDGTDPIGDLIPADPRIRYVRLPERRTIGAKRNLGCEAATGEIIVQWDDDDWMAAGRLSYQVEELLRQDVDVVGLRTVRFLEPATRRCWQYTYQGRLVPWLYEPTFCFRRSFGLARPFADEQFDLDLRFLSDNRDIRVAALADSSFYVAMIHAGNTASKDTANEYWRQLAPDEFATLMGADWPGEDLREGPVVIDKASLAGGSGDKSDDRRDPIRVFLLDDHEIVRRGLREMLAEAGGIEVVGESGLADEAIRRILALRPDVAVLDARLPDGSGIDVCREVRARDERIQAIILTSYDDTEALFAAILAGASGYVLKQIRGTDLADAIRRVAAGESLLDRAVADEMLQHLRQSPPEDKRLASLTSQERRILMLITDGLTNRQIAERMFITEKTVKNYASNLFAKLGVQRRTQAAVYGASLRDK